MYHPIFRTPIGKIVFATWWIAVTAIHCAVLYFFYHIEVSIAVTDSLVWGLLFSILSLGLWFWVEISDIETQRPLTIAVNHIGAAAVTVLLLVALHRFVLTQILLHNNDYLNFLDYSLLGRIILGVSLYVLIVLVYYLIIYINNFRQKLVHEAELKALVKDAELSWLKLQLNPHFLFNSLNSVSSLTLTAPEKASEMITRLSELLRYSLRQSPDTMVTLNDEIENCEKYLEIEKVRFGDRLDYSINSCPECLTVTVPSMLLQPLFENAIKHSVAQTADTSFIKAEVEIVKGFLCVKIENSLPSFPTNSAGNGVGLDNIRRRLILIYGTPNLLFIEKSESAFRVTVSIPIN
ncbi:MAG: histidine kinase [Bacteroidales bacterium]